MSHSETSFFSDRNLCIFGNIIGSKTIISELIWLIELVTTNSDKPYLNCVVQKNEN